MIERIPDQIPVQTGEWRGTTFDIIPKETFAMACRKINELVDAVNELTDPCQDPKAYKIMKEKDKIIARHIQEKNDSQRKLDIAVDGLKRIEKLTEPSYKNRNLEALALAVNTFSGEIIEQINQRNNNE